MAVKFDLTMVDGLADRLEKAADAMDRKLGSARAKANLNRALSVITKDAKARIHSVSGNLVKGIDSRITIRADAPTELEIGVSYKRLRTAHHAHLVEGGHKGPHPAPPHPFWQPAVEAHGEECVELLETAAAQLMDDVIKEL